MRKVALNNVELMDYLLMAVVDVLIDYDEHNEAFNSFDYKRNKILQWWSKKYADNKPLKKVERINTNIFVLYFKD